MKSDNKKCLICQTPYSPETFTRNSTRRCTKCTDKVTNDHARKKHPLRRLITNMYCSSRFGTHQFPSKIGLKYLNKLYEEQKGKCFYSGVEMKLTSETHADPFLISVDRISSPLGYVEGNIVLCCLGMNWLKNRHTPDILFNSLKVFYEGSKANGKIV